MLKISRDINGNKTLKFTPGPGARGFSVQTNGNLPRTHSLAITGDFNEQIADGELYSFISKFGTDRQKELLNIF